MFPITRVAVSAANTARKVAKNVATAKIDITKATDTFQAYAKKVAGEGAPKSIFKQAFLWVKEFASNFKEVFVSARKAIAAKKEELGKAFKMKDAKALVKEAAATLQAKINIIKTELAELLSKKQA